MVLVLKVEDSPTSLPSSSYGGVIESTEPVTFSDLGINFNPTTRRTVFGKVQTCHSLKVLELAFLVLSTVSFLTSMGLTIERLINLNTHSDDYTFAIILCVATVFCFYYAVEGIFLERPFELLVCVCSTIIVAIYTVLNFSYGVTNIIKLIRMVVALVLGAALVTTGSKIAYEYYTSRDLILRTVGASLKLQSACNILFIKSSLLGFDLQLCISMLVFVMERGIQVGDTEKIILGIGVPFSVFWLIIGYVSLRFESKPLSYLFILTSWMQPAYVIYRFCKLKGEDPVLVSSIIACGAAALLVRALLIFFTILAMCNFGIGLKDKVYGRRTPRESIAQ